MRRGWSKGGGAVILFFLPIGLDRVYRRLPIATLFLCALNIVVFLSLAGWPFLRVSDEVTLELALIANTPTFSTMMSAMFLNPDIAHLLVNVVFLCAFGPIIEEEVGSVLFFMLYIVGGLAGEVAQIGAIQHLVPSNEMKAIIGASGAVSCLMGIFAVRYSYARVKVMYAYWIVVFARAGITTISAGLGIGIWLGLQIVLGAIDVFFRHTMGVGHFAHLGAFVLGLGIAATAGMARQARHDQVREKIVADIKEGPLGEAHIAELSVMASPNDYHRQLAAGHTWAKLEDREKACEHYTRALTLGIAAGDRDAAVEAYDAARTCGISPQMTSRERLTIANVMMEMERYREAADLFDAIYESPDKSAEKPVALLRSAQIRIEHLQLPEDGERLLRKFLDEYPGDEWESFVRTMLADAETRRGTGIGSHERPMKGPN